MSTDDKIVTRSTTTVHHTNFCKKGTVYRSSVFPTEAP